MLELEKSIEGVLRWVEARHYKGYEPADGNASPLRLLACGNTFLQRLLQQLVLRSPVNIRPFARDLSDGIATGPGIYGLRLYHDV